MRSLNLFGQEIYIHHRIFSKKFDARSNEAEGLIFSIGTKIQHGISLTELWEIHYLIIMNTVLQKSADIVDIKQPRRNSSQKEVSF